MFEKISGKKIKEAIKQAGLKQQDIADILNSKQSYVSQIINEKTNISEKTLRKIATATGKPLTYFIDNNKKDFNNSKTTEDNNIQNTSGRLDLIEEKVKRIETEIELLKLKIK